VALGPLVLGELKKGATRALTAEQKKALDRAMGLV
jgi:16S rRNA U516 pseudouridylate synthase RsuA-like enzyme